MSDLKLYSGDFESSAELPFAQEGVRAGFPSPAQDYMFDSIDLNRDIIKHKESTFYARVTGDSLCDAGVLDGDIVVVDKSLTPEDGDMAVCCVEGEFTLKYIEKHDDYVLLIPANPTFKPLRVNKEDHFMIWGVVTHVIHKVTRRK